RRVILGALLGGLAMFVWGALSHAVLGFTDRALKSLPDEAPVIATIESKVPEHGIYFYPGLPAGVEKQPKAEQQAALQRMAENEKLHPHGILVVAPPSAAARLSPANLLRQLLGDVAAALAAALVLALAGIGRYAARLAVVVLIGAFAGCAILLPY